jgi:hypothetical protein
VNVSQPDNKILRIVVRRWGGCDKDVSFVATTLISASPNESRREYVILMRLEQAGASTLGDLENI